RICYLVSWLLTRRSPSTGDFPCVKTRLDYIPMLEVASEEASLLPACRAWKIRIHRHRSVTFIFLRVPAVDTRGRSNSHWTKTSPSNGDDTCSLSCLLSIETN
ncbi:unnamed protein product, partial [Ectocarpus sp. 8 AP-2014]